MQSPLKATFFHDHKFLTCESGKVYSPGQFPYRVWERYLEVFESLTVVARSGGAVSAIDCSRHDLSSGPKVDFVLLPDLSSPHDLLRHGYHVVRSVSQEVRRADVVIARASRLGLLAARRARAQGKPYALEVVGCPADALWTHGRMSAKLYAPILAAELRRATAAAPFVVYVTKSFLQARYPTRGVAESISNVEVRPSDEPDFLARRLRRVSVLHDRPVLGLIGSLTSKYKGIGTAIRAMQSLKADYPTLQLHVLGPGDATPWINLAHRYGCTASIRFCGTVPSGEPVSRWLDDLDIYLQPSRAEGMPRALIEAMARGLPAVGSSVGGITELLDESAQHASDSTEGLVRRIRLALESSAWRVAQARRNFSVAQDFTFDKLATRRRAFLERVAECVRAPRGAPQP